PLTPPGLWSKTRAAHAAAPRSSPNLRAFFNRPPAESYPKRMRPVQFRGQNSDFPRPINAQAAAGYDQSIAGNWKQNLRVVLVETRNPLNIGAAARAMANFGFTRLHVVNPYDVAFREARSAVGAAPLLQASEEFSSLAGAIAECHLVVG